MTAESTAPLLEEKQSMVNEIMCDEKVSPKRDTEQEDLQHPALSKSCTDIRKSTSLQFDKSGTEKIEDYVSVAHEPLVSAKGNVSL